MFSRDDGSYMMNFSCVFVICFAVIACIGKQLVYPEFLDAKSQRFGELIHIGTWPSDCNCREYEMITAIADNHQFGPAFVSGCLIEVWLSGASFYEVLADMAGL